MSRKGSVHFIGFGESIPQPEQMVSNDDVLRCLAEQGGDTRGKTGEDTERLIGIRTRWWSQLSSTEHALDAARTAVADAQRRVDGGFEAGRIELLHSGGSTPDHVFPACACQLQGELGIAADSCEARDISLACTSWIDALLLAASRMRDKGLRYGLVVTGESIGTRLNAPTTLSYCLWGDGGGAVVLEHDPAGDPEYGIIADRAISDGQFADWTRSIGLGTHLDHETVDYSDASMGTHGKDIHRYAIRVVTSVIERMLAEVDTELARTFLLPHNANLGMVRQIGKRLDLSPDNVLTRIVERGNTSSASIPITLAHHAARETFRRGDLLVLAGFGGGMSIGIVLYRWP